MYSPSLRILLLLVCAASAHLCFRAPNPPPSPEEQLKKTSTFEKKVRWVTFSCQAGAMIAAMCDAVATYGVAYAPAELQRYTCFRPLPVKLLEIEPIFLLGVCMMVIGAIVRQWCFRTLGRFFTFEVSIIHSHRLVQEGPYAYARHPSYTGIFLVLAGATTVMCSKNSWFRQCGLLQRGGAPVLALWMALCFWSANCLRLRLRVEDEELKIRFGKIWEEYAARVPYTLIPGLV